MGLENELGEISFSSRHTFTVAGYGQPSKVVACTEETNPSQYDVVILTSEPAALGFFSNSLKNFQYF